MKNLIFIITFFFMFPIIVFSQLTVTTGTPPATLVQNTLIGSGVYVSNVTYTGHPNAIGHFITGTSPTNLGLTEGIVLSSGNLNLPPPVGNPVSGFSASTNSTPGDALLNTITTSITYDAAILTFNFIPLSDTIKFRYVFGSEEYLEWVGSSYNDVFGFFVNGPNPQGGNYINRNIALIPNTTIPVTINNVHGGSFSQFYVDNEAIGGQTIVFDGFTTVLTAWLRVVPCSTYSIKIAIADAGDSNYDSAVFLEANSFGTSGVTVNTNFSIPAIGSFAVEGCNNAIMQFCLQQASPTSYSIPMQIVGTATNGVDYTQIPSSLTIPAGQLCIDFLVEAFIDNLAEGSEFIEIVVQTNICAGIDTIVIEIDDYFQPEAIMSSDTTICIGESTLISAMGNLGISPYTYLWDNIATSNTQTVNPQITTTYTVTITDMCSETASGNVVVNIATTDVYAGVDQTICNGETAILTATGGTSYQWSTGDTGPTISVNPSQTTTYSVTATGVCIPIDTVTVFISPAPQVLVTQPPSVCCNERVNISASGAESYIWTSSPPDQSLGSQNTDSSIYVKPGISTTYTVIGSNQWGCSDTATVFAEIYPSPVADFIIDPTVVSSFEPIVNFFDMSTNIPVSWYWDFGDNNFSNEQNPTHIYPDSGGLYPVVLYVSTIYGCIDSIDKFVYVRPDFLLYVPNAFTPNSDGINDEIGILYTSLSPIDFEWIIMDRWGKNVYYSTDIHEKWDGKYNGNLLKDGVYHYKLIFRDKTTKLHERYGYIVLIR